METIAAISTAPGVGGIGIIRMSGQNCFKILEKVFEKKNNKDKNIKGYTMKYGYIVDKKNNSTIDEVLVSYFVAPKSYTTENMCEINSHGGSIIMKKILELLLENGAILAEPGEFTKRAFLNGRIDLAQAEAIIDIINSKTEKEALSSIKQLNGYLSEEINKIKDKILEVMVDIEASIDYPEYDIPNVTEDRVLSMLEDAKKDLHKLRKTFAEGKIIKEGIKLVIIGKPNAGKSSLLNAILREERAIVTSVKGTTRDTIEEFINIKGIPIKIIDTAGIRETFDEVERIGIEKTKGSIEEADLVIGIFDSSKELEEEDVEVLNILKNKKSIVVLNKNDNPNIILTEKTKEICDTKKDVIKISALKKQGIEEIFDKISEMFNLDEINIGEENIVTNLRHKNLIENAERENAVAIEEIKNGMPIDMITINIKNMLESLLSITGENVTENIIDEIFAKFCLGK